MGAKKIKNPSEGKLYNRHLADFMENPRKIGSFRAKGFAFLFAQVAFEPEARKIALAIMDDADKLRTETLARIKSETEAEIKNNEAENV